MPQSVSPAGPDYFRALRLTRDELPRLLTGLGRDRRQLTNVMPLIGPLSRQPAGSYTDIRQVASESARQLTPAAIRFVRDHFLSHVNGLLQALYRRHFRHSPPAEDASHDARIESLEAVRSDAEAVVASLDWNWLVSWLRLADIGEDRQSSLRRLSNFAFPCVRVTFRLTYHCNIACRHCYNNSGPEMKSHHLELEPMLDIIREMPDAGLTALNLTGGEPLLYADELVRLIQLARSRGVTEISIYSNGFWAATEESADRMLLRLKAAGFMASRRDHLKVSSGRYHAEFIGLERIALLARRFRAIFERPITVDFEVGESDSDDVETVRATLAAAGVPCDVRVDVRRVHPLGRGRTLNLLHRTRPIDWPCSHIDQIVFDPDGVVRPCCGLNNENHGVAIGHLERDSLERLIRRMQNDPVLQFLRSNPMQSIFELVEREPSPRGYVGPCDLCQDALGALRNKEQLQRRLFHQQEFYPFAFAR